MSPYRAVVPNLWYAYHYWYAKVFQVVRKYILFVIRPKGVLSKLSRSVIPKLCATTDSQVFREAFWKKNYIDIENKACRQAYET